MSSSNVTIEGLAEKFNALEKEWKVTRERSLTPRRRQGSPPPSNAPSAPPATSSRRASVAASPISLSRRSPQRDASVGRERSSRSLSKSADGSRGAPAAGARRSPQRPRSPASKTIGNVPALSSSTPAASAPLKSQNAQPDDPVEHPKFCWKCGFDLRSCKAPPKFCRECGSRL